MEIRKLLKEVYDEMCMSLVMVGKWVKQFTERRTDVHDVQRSERLTDSMSFDNMQQLNLLKEDYCMMISELCFHLQLQIVVLFTTFSGFGNF